MRKAGRDLKSFDMKAPTYDSPKKRWTIFFVQNTYMAVIDGDMVVFVDDGSSKACVQQIMAPGVCI
jgi:hypothetical protein